MPDTSREDGSSQHPIPSSSLPQEVVECLRNARFLHLSTCNNSIPHISLMNYTYLPASTTRPSLSLPSGPIIIMTTTPSSQKTANLTANPRVSILVHDWVSPRPSAYDQAPSDHLPNGTSLDRAERRPSGSLSTLLQNLNTAELSSISCTINGTATLLERGSEEEKWCKARHLENNRPADGATEDGGRERYVMGEDVRVVVVKIRDGRISDWTGGVSDFELQEGV